MKKLTLSAAVQVIRGQAKRPGVRVTELTCVTVSLGNTQVAMATVAGRYDAAGGLKEFLKTATHPRWTRMPGWGSAVLAGMIPGVRAA